MDSCGGMLVGDSCCNFRDCQWSLVVGKWFILCSIRTNMWLQENPETQKLQRFQGHCESHVYWESINQVQGGEVPNIINERGEDVLVLLFKLDVCKVMCVCVPSCS